SSGKWWQLWKSGSDGSDGDGTSGSSSTSGNASGNDEDGDGEEYSAYVEEEYNATVEEEYNATGYDDDSVYTSIATAENYVPTSTNSQGAAALNIFPFLIAALVAMLVGAAVAYERRRKGSRKSGCGNIFLCQPGDDLNEEFIEVEDTGIRSKYEA
ncbi:hypothetical protein ACHAWF_008438, partial [Thalassiosira exigua]